MEMLFACSVYNFDELDILYHFYTIQKIQTLRQWLKQYNIKYNITNFRCKRCICFSGLESGHRSLDGCFKCMFLFCLCIQMDLIQLFHLCNRPKFFPPPQCTNASVWLFCLSAIDPSTIIVTCYGCVCVTINFMLQTLILRKTAATIVAAYCNLELYHLLQEGTIVFGILLAKSLVSFFVQSKV